MVSALGADRQSRVSYRRVKGEMENAVRKPPFDGVHIFRPSLLLGDRRFPRWIGWNYELKKRPCRRPVEKAEYGLIFWTAGESARATSKA